MQRRIFNISDTLKTKKILIQLASMVTNGYLLMFGPEHAEEQYKALENHVFVMQEQKILKA